MDQYNSSQCVDAFNKIYNLGNNVNGYDLIRECYYGNYPPVPPNSS